MLGEISFVDQGSLAFSPGHLVLSGGKRMLRPALVITVLILVRIIEAKPGVVALDWVRELHVLLHLTKIRAFIFTGKSAASLFASKRGVSFVAVDDVWLARRGVAPLAALTSLGTI